jgi:hypothetical protein
MSRSAASCFLSVRPARQGRSRCPAGRSLCGCPPMVGVALFRRAFWPGTAAGLWLEKGLFCSKKRCPPRGRQQSAGEEGGGVDRVIIGVDPQKLSATIEVLDQRENVLGGGRFGTDRDGYRQMLTVGRRWPDRVWAVEGCNGIGRHVAQRLVADGETVLDVPAKLSAEVAAGRSSIPQLGGLVTADIPASLVSGGRGLPQVCVRHGEPAIQHSRVLFRSHPPRWTYLLILCGLLPFAIAAGALQKRVKATAWPFCRRCSRLRTSRLLAGTAMVVVAVLAVGVLAAVVPEGSAYGPPIVLAFLVLLIAGLGIAAAAGRNVICVRVRDAGRQHGTATPATPALRRARRRDASSGTASIPAERVSAAPGSAAALRSPQIRAG